MMDHKAGPINFKRLAFSGHDAFNLERDRKMTKRKYPHVWKFLKISLVNSSWVKTRSKWNFKKNDTVLIYMITCGTQLKQCLGVDLLS